MSGSFSFISAASGLSSLSAIVTGSPTLQTNRPISFILEDNGSIVDTVELTLRPEDLTRNDPSRLTVHQTLGGAWADYFGPGVPSISISGHTGWRGGLDGSGEERWRRLRDNVWKGWAGRKRRAVENGRDPAQVKLIFADALNQFVSEVAPMNLQLRRSRSRPLLIQYQMAMIVLDENEEQIKYLKGGTRDAGDASGGFFASVTSSIDTIRDGIASARAWVNTNLIAPVRSFLGMANTVFTAAVGAVRDTRNLVGSVLTVPMLIASAGAILFRTIAATATLPMQIRADVMGMAAAFTNIWCFMIRAASTRLAYEDYSAFYGASNCSSISGGLPVSPLAGTNPWETVPFAASTTPGVAISTRGHDALLAMAAWDPVLSPPANDEIATQLGEVSSGVTATEAA